jgi:RND family efflux transporter MFP subunit
MKKRRLPICTLIAAGLAIWVAGCASNDQHHEEAEGESWAVTAWGRHFEIFAETDGLEVGTMSIAFTHVTVLDDFTPLSEGVVSVVLSDASGGENVFSIEQMIRPGIFSVPLLPEARGEFDLEFRIETAERSAVIPAGRVLVGDKGSPGGLIEASTVSADAKAAAAVSAGADISFLKEQQWRTEFATEWVAEGVVRESVIGPGRIEAAAGGEVLLTSPLSGVISAKPWPYPGHGVKRGDTVFRVTPRVASERSLAELTADVKGLEAAADASGRRLARLEELLELGASSRREIEEARARQTGLTSQLEAAQKDLATARSGRRGGSPSAETVAVRAPFSGRIATIDVTPGQAVAAEVPLGLFLRESPLWVAVALRPEVAAGIKAVEGLDVRLPNGHEPLQFRGEQFRLVSVSPAVDPESGSVAVLFEIGTEAASLPIGIPVEVEILLAGEKRGIVVPQTALVDDSGIPVVYLQTGGESFVRTEVEVLARQGGRVQIEGAEPGARIVERGGNTIRRATLLSQDTGEAHVH